jgi:hypothetical protein
VSGGVIHDSSYLSRKKSKFWLKCNNKLWLAFSRLLRTTSVTGFELVFTLVMQGSDAVFPFVVAQVDLKTEIGVVP